MLKRTLALALFSLVSLAPAPASAAPARCQALDVPVSLAPGQPADQHISGTLCVPRGAGTVQLLLAGGSYSRQYWDFPGTPSYVDHMNRAGYATLAIDRLGTGRSSRPHSSQYQPATHQNSVYQVVQHLRKSFGKVILVGNSLGSTLARMVAVNHPGSVDALILTGESSTPDWAAFERLSADFQPLATDAGYITTRPGAKSAWFYHPRTASRAVIAADEATPEADVYPADPGFGDVGLNKQIRVPVLVAVGEHDKLLCGTTACTSSAALLASERPFYDPATPLAAYVVRDTGHVINLHRTAPRFYAHARGWLATV